MPLETASIMPTVRASDFAIGRGRVFVGERKFSGPWARLVMHGEGPTSEVRLVFAVDEISHENLRAFFEGMGRGQTVFYLPNNPVGLDVNIRLNDAHVMGTRFNLKGGDAGESGQHAADGTEWETLVFSARTTRSKLVWGTSFKDKPPTGERA